MVSTMIKDAFGFSEGIKLTALNTGLINTTLIAEETDGKKYLLQKINTNIFPNPQAIQENYVLISSHLKNKGSFALPEVIKTVDGQLLFTSLNEGAWRVFSFVDNSYSPLASTNPTEAALVAQCFGKFAADLTGIDTSKIQAVLPGFHDLQWRYQQFEDAMQTASAERKETAAQLIEKAYANKDLVDYYNRISADKENYPLHVLHHDCKIANILLHKETQAVICPVDLDTTQNGLFFSDLGDMFRSMTPSLPENAKEIEQLELRTDYYEAIKAAYLEAVKGQFTEKEIADIDMAGKIIIYMQSLRFLTDYLNNDIYYKIEYPEQNYYRAANQFRLLELVLAYTQK